MSFNEHEKHLRLIATVAANTEWVIQHREGAICVDARTISDRSGGMDITCLAEEGLTPATRLENPDWGVFLGNFKGG